MGSHMENKKDTLKNLIAERALTYPKTSGELVLYGSGKTPSWMFDFRPLLLDPHFLKILGEVFKQQTKEREINSIGGLESAAIPLVTALCMETNTPGFFVRKSRKKKASMRQIEGTASEDHILLVDDLINSGGSIKKQITVLEAEGKTVRDVFVLVQFQPYDAYSFLKERNITLHSLFTLKDFGITYTHSKDVSEHFTTEWYFKPNSPHFFEQGPKYTPCVYKNSLVTLSDNGLLWKLDRESGHVIQKKRLLFRTNKAKTTFTTPMIYNDTMIIGTYRGKLFFIDSDTLKVNDALSLGDQILSTPTHVNNIIVVPVKDGVETYALVGIDMETKEEIWRETLDAEIKGGLISNEGIGYGNTVSGTAYAFDANGVISWETSLPGAIQSKPVMLEEEKKLLVSCMNGALYLLDTKNGNVDATIPVSEWLYGAPAILGNTAFVSSLDSFIYAVDLDTKSILWEKETGGRIYSTPVVWNKAVYVGNNDGKLYALDVESGDVVGTFQTAERIVNPIVVDPEKTNVLFLSTFAGEIYSLRKR